MSAARIVVHKVQLWPTEEQANYFARACGCRRHAYNQLLAHFGQSGVKWSKKAAYSYFMKRIKPKFPWYSEVSSRITRNAINDLDLAFEYFFRRVKSGKRTHSKTNPYGFPKFKKRGESDSFSIREAEKFTVSGRWVRIEKLKTKIKMRQALRFSGKTKQVTISQTAGRWYAAILIAADNYDTKGNDRRPSVGVDLGVKRLATLSDGSLFPANQALKNNQRRLARRQRNLSTKMDRTSRRAMKAKLSVARLHHRIACQRRAATHAVSNYVTANFDLITIEDLNVQGMMNNRRLARAVADAGMGTTRDQIRYKSKLRGNWLVEADRWHPSTKTCSECGVVNPDVVLGVDWWTCDSCKAEHDRDDNAAKNLDRYGLHTLRADLKRAQESCETGLPSGLVDGANIPPVLGRCL